MSICQGRLRKMQKPIVMTNRVHLVLEPRDLLDILIGFVDQVTVGNLLDLQLVLKLLDHRVMSGTTEGGSCLHPRNIWIVGDVLLQSLPVLIAGVCLRLQHRFQLPDLSFQFCNLL